MSVHAFEPTPSAITHTQTNESGLSGANTQHSKDAGTTSDMTTTTTTEITRSDDIKSGGRRNEKGVNVAVKVLFG